MIDTKNSLREKRVKVGSVELSNVVWIADLWRAVPVFHRARPWPGVSDRYATVIRRQP